MKRNKDSKYYSHLRKDLIDLVKGEGNKILDIGCGEGVNGAELKRTGKAREVVGVEIFEPAALKAKEKLDNVMIGDIQTISLPYPGDYFDYIILGDVIEHLFYPWETMKKLKGYLSPSGFVVASIPNIGYWEVLKDLILFDRWNYVKAGILDETHLRFFTRKSIVELFESSGLMIVELIPHIPVRFMNKLGVIITLGSLKRFFTAGYMIKASKK